MVKSRDSLFITLLKYGTMMVIIALMFIPFFWIFATSLRSPQESFSLPPLLFPKPPLITENYARVFTTFPFFRIIINSVVVTVISVAVQLILSSMTAFGIARIPFKGRNILFLIILAGLMIPSQVIIIPLFIAMSKLRLTNTLFSLILTSIVSSFSIFLLRQFMLSIPLSYDEAATLDGAGRFTIYLRIIVPMIKPSLFAAGLFHFLTVWNEFFKPLIFLNSSSKMTLPIGLYTLQGYMGSGNLSVVMAGVIISIIPSLGIYILGQRFITEGARIGGIKG